MYQPTSTYRFQFHKDFTFSDFEKVIPYLQKLGVSTVYASPVFEAVPGSTHGYDGIDPLHINPEIGTLDQLKKISHHLRKMDMGWLQDIVPNHMAFDTRNEWLMDVLEKGQQSIYASFFDIAWNNPDFEGKLMVPFMGKTLKEVIKEGELKVAIENGRLVFKYYDAAYPLNPRSYATILSVGENPSESVQQLQTQMQGIKEVEDAKTYSKGWDEWLLQLTALLKNAVVHSYIQECIEQVNKDADLLQQIADEQVYRLCHWQETDKQINYRRFFTVNGLICLNIQDEQVFTQYHQLVKQLVDEGMFQGLRIDHIDGLYDPATYLERLKELAGDETYIVVEKILHVDETLPNNWAIEGNTGYDFLAIVNNLLTNKKSEPQFTQFYYSLLDEQLTVAQQVRNKKAHILYEHMGGELDNLYRLFTESNLVESEVVQSIPADLMKRAIGQFLVNCPVYRYYAISLPLIEEAPLVQEIIDRIRQTEPELTEAIAVLEKVLLILPHHADESYKFRAVHFYKRCMQFSGPLMAKGVEDTLMYTFNRFIVHNEVGDAPGSFGISMDDFHQRMKQRQLQSPFSLNATSTHDTKRGEDVRARLNVLTSMPDQWLKSVKEWMKLNEPLKKKGMPSVNDEYFIYQTIIGTYPIEKEEELDYPERLKEYLQKALREAKVHSNWTTPNEEYEQAAKDFAVALLDKNSDFWKRFQPLLQQVTEGGITNSLSQVLLKFTCPGVPDVYQGCELWDLSFVDPDNRRPVDYTKRATWLEELQNSNDVQLWQKLWQSRRDAKIKLWLVYSLMQLRRSYADLFSFGDYIPLPVEGSYKDHVIAFARRHKSTWLIVVAPLNTAALNVLQNENVEALDWKNTAIVLPKAVSGEWKHLLIEKTGQLSRNRLMVKDLFGAVPFFIGRMEGTLNERGAGVLLHITSLASPFGIGDLGPQAKAFADLLHKGGQKYWQLLPINPTEGGQGHSPYSATSSMAGNTLLISPEELRNTGLLTQVELNPFYLQQLGKTDFEEAERVKGKLFEKAWQAFKNNKVPAFIPLFDAFCAKEQEWLEGFSQYTLLKQKQEGKPWYEWPDEMKLREEKAIETFVKENEEALQKIKFLQFLFFRQWQQLKQYCNQRNIQLIGDLPFYVSYDSADVWMQRDIFKLDDNGVRLGVAGVPPDAFSADGQLWGMPVFRWEVLKGSDYDWWINRLKKNTSLFDLVRLDHFRAFADYWEVPADEQTARNGQWMPGPGVHFFETLKKQLGVLPFVAEDLGDINEDVLSLRDDFNMPGMKILQFAFGDENGVSDYLPHNYSNNFFVYTGTHDNNTTKGWFRKEAEEDTRRRLQKYLGVDVGEETVSFHLSRLAYASVANTAIIPLQDIIGLNENARMNIPASGENNWAWRLFPGQVTIEHAQLLKEWAQTYNRL